MLHFTVKLRGNERGDFFSAGNIPGAGAALTTSPAFFGQRHYQDFQQNTNAVFNSQWAEVVYFLRATGDTAKGTPLFALYRRQLLLVPDSGLITNAGGIQTTVPGAVADYPEMSCVTAGANGYFNNPRDITMPARRLGTQGLGTTLADVAGKLDPANNDPATGLASYPTMFDTTKNNVYQGADIVLSDVLSFEVRLLLADGNHFESLYDITGATGGYRAGSNTLFPVRNPAFSTAGPLVFDTWTNAIDANSALGSAYDYSLWNTATNTTGSRIPIYQRSINNANGTTTTTTIHVRAVQVTIRVWDVKTEQARQITIVQDL